MWRRVEVGFGEGLEDFYTYIWKTSRDGMEREHTSHYQLESMASLRKLDGDGQVHKVVSRQNHDKFWASDAEKIVRV